MAESRMEHCTIGRHRVALKDRSLPQLARSRPHRRGFLRAHRSECFDRFREAFWRIERKTPAGPFQFERLKWRPIADENRHTREESVENGMAEIFAPRRQKKQVTIAERLWNEFVTDFAFERDRDLSRQIGGDRQALLEIVAVLHGTENVERHGPLDTPQYTKRIVEIFDARDSAEKRQAKHPFALGNRPNRWRRRWSPHIRRDENSSPMRKGAGDVLGLTWSGRMEPHVFEKAEPSSEREVAMLAAGIERKCASGEFATR
nr:hypothetical protein [Methylosinus sporium]